MTEIFVALIPAIMLLVVGIGFYQLFKWELINDPNPKVAESFREYFEEEKRKKKFLFF